LVARIAALTTIGICDVTPDVVTKVFIDVLVFVIVATITTFVCDCRVRIGLLDRKRGATTRDTERHKSAREHHRSISERRHMQSFRRESVHTRFLRALHAAHNQRTFTLRRGIVRRLGSAA
jgi:hypothetical protein